MYKNISGHGNVANGYMALDNNTIGTNNVANGSEPSLCNLANTIALVCKAKAMKCGGYNNSILQTPYKRNIYHHYHMP